MMTPLLRVEFDQKKVHARAHSSLSCGGQWVYSPDCTLQFFERCELQPAADELNDNDEGSQ